MYADLKANLTAMPGHIGDLACITAYARARARARAHTHTHTHCICQCDGKPVRSMPDAGTLAPIRFVTRLPATHESYTDVAWRSVRHCFAISSFFRVWGQEMILRRSRHSRSFAISSFLLAWLILCASFSLSSSPPSLFLPSSAP